MTTIERELPEMRVDRLLHMADFLENVLPKQSEKCLFDIGTVAADQVLEDLKEGKPYDQWSCKSHACVVGWTPAAFPNDKEVRFDMTRYGLNVVINDPANPTQVLDNYERVGAIFYGLTSYEADYLFSPASYFIPSNYIWVTNEEGEESEIEIEYKKYANDQAQAVARLRQVAQHWQESGKHFTDDECYGMATESEKLGEEQHRTRLIKEGYKIV